MADKKKCDKQLCWTCGRACGGCSWSRTFLPVNGWTAKSVRIKQRIKNNNVIYIDSYIISACPEYIKDHYESDSITP